MKLHFQKDLKMNIEERWEKWEPIEGLTGYYYIDSICNNKYGLKIILVKRKDKKKELHITFNTGVYSFRDTDDSYTIDKITVIGERQGDEELFCSTSFFKVTNSEYVKWLSEMSRDISDYPPLEHLVIVTEDSTFEMLTHYRPKAEYIDLS